MSYLYPKHCINQIWWNMLVIPALRRSVEEEQKVKSEIYRYSLLGRYLETGLGDRRPF